MNFDLIRFSSLPLHRAISAISGLIVVISVGASLPFRASILREDECYRLEGESCRLGIRDRSCNGAQEFIPVFVLSKYPAAPARMAASLTSLSASCVRNKIFDFGHL
jgi:hypothetical protein